MLERTVGVQPLRVAVYCFCFILYHKSHEVSAKMRKRSNVCVCGSEPEHNWRPLFGTFCTHTHWRGLWRSFQSPTLMHATICVFGWHDSAKIPTVTRHILINQSLVFLLVDCTLVVGASCTIQASHCVCTTNGHRHIYVPRRRRQIDK